VSVKFYWSSIQDPHIIPFVKVILDRVPNVKILIGGEVAFETT
jgi:hypothetical protein